MGNACNHSYVAKEQTIARITRRTSSHCRNEIYCSKLHLVAEFGCKIELMVKSREVCQAVRKAPPSAPLYPWRWPTRVWQRVHIDFAEKDGNYFLGLIDSHSKWIEVAHMRSTTAQSTIDHMRLWFAAYGFSEEVVSDNGPQFISQDFTNFLKQNGVKQTLVPPYHPSSNGAAERTVQILKQALRKHAESVKRGGNKRSLKHPLANCLIQYRNTPHSVTAVTPSELFLKRKARTKFSVPLRNMEGHIQDQQGKQQRQHDKSRVKMRELSARDSVNVRNTRGEVGPRYSDKKVRTTDLPCKSWSPTVLCPH